MTSVRKHSFLYRNGLSIVLLVVMLLLWLGQALTGWHEHNDTLQEFQQPALTFGQYLRSGHFMSATFENWESEFLQMAAYVLLTVWLRQKGSAESNPLKGEKGDEEPDVELQPKPGSPWPVRRGGWWLRLYSYSLTLVLALLFALSFYFHFRGSLRNYNEEQAFKGQPNESAWQYLGESHFWFESFQNWQSEFLAVAAIVLLSIWFRQKGSPESKPVNAPDSQTGDEEE